VHVSVHKRRYVTTLPRNWSDLVVPLGDLEKSATNNRKPVPHFDPFFFATSSTAASRTGRRSAKDQTPLGTRLSQTRLTLYRLGSGWLDPPRCLTARPAAAPLHRLTLTPQAARDRGSRAAPTHTPHLRQCWQHKLAGGNIIEAISRRAMCIAFLYGEDERVAK